MSSTVTNYSNKINSSYPVPGVDNDTQGFRDNFANIKNALQATAQELSYLDLNTAKLNTGTNDYNYGSDIYRAKLRAGGIVSTVISAQPTTNVSFQSGGYHTVTADGAVTLRITDWAPAGLYASIKFEVLNFDTGSSSVTFDVAGSTLKKEAALTLPHVLSASTTTSHMFELWTADGGGNVFVKFLGTYTNV
jgi:hypothetical protein